MPRIRSIHYDAWKSEKLAVASDGAERCYWRIHPYMDDQGRGEDHPRLIAATCFPLRDEATSAVVDAWLSELADLGLVVRYEADSARLIQVEKWATYQHPQKPRKSTYPPPPPADSGSGTRPVPDPDGTSTARRGGEGSGSGEGDGDVTPNSRNTRGTVEKHLSTVVDISSPLGRRAARHAGETA